MKHTVKLEGINIKEMCGTWDPTKQVVPLRLQVEVSGIDYAPIRIANPSAICGVLWHRSLDVKEKEKNLDIEILMTIFHKGIDYYIAESEQDGFIVRLAFPEENHGKRMS